MLYQLPSARAVHQPTIGFGWERPQWVESGRRRAMIICMIRHALATAGSVLALSSAAPARAQTANESITISRAPWGLHQASDPDFAVTLWPDGRVVVHTPGEYEPVENGDRFQVSPVEAARFRAALSGLKPVEAGMTIFCRGRLGPGQSFMSRVPTFAIHWNSPAFDGGVTACDPAGHVRILAPDGSENVCEHSRACDGSQERAIVDAIEAALREIHLGLDGRRR
jgi:hypothetical protein